MVDQELFERAMGFLSDEAERRVREVMALVDGQVIGVRYDVATNTAVAGVEVDELRVEVWADGTLWLPDREMSVTEVLALASRVARIDAAVEAAG